MGNREIAAGVYPATPVYVDKAGSKLDWLMGIHSFGCYHEE